MRSPFTRENGHEKADRCGGSWVPVCGLASFALGGDSATIAQLQAENAAITAGNLSINPQAFLRAITPVGQGGGTESSKLQPVQADNALTQSLLQ